MNRSHEYSYVKPFGEKVKDCCRSTIAFLFSNVGVCGLMLGYTITGALIFKEIEGKKSPLDTLCAENIRNETIEQLWNITMAHNVLDQTKWKEAVNTTVQQYQGKIVDLVMRGWLGNDTTVQDKWTLAGGFLYSLTVITTIGNVVITAHGNVSLPQ